MIATVAINHAGSLGKRDYDSSEWRILARK